jgi:ubiquinone/menaquinone biosynthesis C-methylase UbiE
LTPELLEAGRRRAEAAGPTLAWVEADAEHLPFEDASFDVVISTIGVMFAPHHQQAADELVRVCRPGGTIGLLSWTPEGMIGALTRSSRRRSMPSVTSGTVGPPTERASSSSTCSPWAGAPDDDARQSARRR